MRMGTRVMRGKVRDGKEGKYREDVRGDYRTTGCHNLLKKFRVHHICHIYFPHICLWVNYVYQ